MTKLSFDIFVGDGDKIIMEGRHLDHLYILNINENGDGSNTYTCCITKHEYVISRKITYNIHSAMGFFTKHIKETLNK